MMGASATPLMELTLMYDVASRARASSGVEIACSLVGNYITSLDMAGGSVTVSLMDDEALSAGAYRRVAVGLLNRGLGMESVVDEHTR